MKTKKALLALMFVSTMILSFTSCQKEKDICGEWNVATVTNSEKFDAEDPAYDEFIKDYFIADDETLNNPGLTFAFKENNIFFIRDTSGDEIGGEYYIEDDQLVMVVACQRMAFKIDELSNDIMNLSLIIKEKDSVQAPDGTDVAFTYTGSIFMKLEKK